MSELLQTLKDNLTFVLVCVIAAAAIIGISVLAEKTLLKGKMVKMSRTRRIATCAMLAAAAGLLHMFDFPLTFFAPTFYELDFSELPVLIGAFSMGPVAGTVIEFVKIMVKLALKGTSTAFVGDFANFFIGCTLVVPASIIYHLNKTRRAAVLGLAAGTVCMAIFGSAFNAVYLIPKFANLYGMPLENIIAMGTKINPRITSCQSMALWAVVPFNIVKGAAVSVMTMLIYKPLSGIIKGK